MTFLASHPLSELYEKSFQAALRARPPELMERLGELAEFVIKGLAQDASDIHLTFDAGAKKISGWLRVNGELRPCGVEADLPQGLEALARLAKVPPQCSDRFFEQPFDFSVSLNVGALEEFSVRFRGSTMPLKGGQLRLVLRSLHAPDYDRFQAAQAALERSELDRAAAPAREPARPALAPRL